MLQQNTGRSPSPTHVLYLHVPRPNRILTATRIPIHQPRMRMPPTLQANRRNMFALPKSASGYEAVVTRSPRQREEGGAVGPYSFLVFPYIVYARVKKGVRFYIWLSNVVWLLFVLSRTLQALKFTLMLWLRVQDTSMAVKCAAKIIVERKINILLGGFFGNM